MNEKFNRLRNNPQLLLFILMLSLYFGRFHLSIGFSLKPFMLVSVCVFFLVFKKISFIKLYKFEFYMFAFVFFHMLTALNLRFPGKSLRFIVLYLIIIFFYFILRYIISNVSLQNVTRIISITGLIAVSLSLFYFMMGVVAARFNFSGNNLDFFGLMIDRNVPRLTGTTSNDPNIYVFYVTMYFFFTATHLKDKLNIFGFVLAASAILLTFSRGGLLGIAFGLFILFILSNNRDAKIKGSVIFIILMLLLWILGDIIPMNPLSFVISRFGAVLKDGGSGRLDIWMNALRTFLQYPLSGLGINSIRDYNLIHFGRGAYVHNTFIEVLVETGVFGTILYVIFWYYTLRNSYRLIRLNDSALFIFISIVSLMFQMSLLSVLYNEMFYLVILLLFRFSLEAEKSIKCTNCIDVLDSPLNINEK